MDRNELRQRLKDYKFFHTIQLGDGLQTPGNPVPEHKKIVMETIASLDLKDKRVLDIGCANGLFSFEAERCGAGEVLAVDNSALPLKPMTELLIPYLGSKIRVRHENILELNKSDIGEFDLIIFGGLLYHLRYPFWSLKIIRDLLVDHGTMILETAVLGDSNRHAILYCPSSTDSPYGQFSNSVAFFNIKALRETLEFLGIKVKTEHVTTKTRKIFLQQIWRLIDPTYQPVRRAVFLCERHSEVSDKELLEVYEGTRSG